MLNKTKLITLLGAAVITLSVSACSNVQSPEINLGNATTAAKTIVSDATLISKGNFSGRSDHVTTGQVSLEKTATGYQLNFASDFSLDGAPDPVVAIGNGETYLAANKIAPLTNKTGGQVYQLPANFTPGQFSQVYVWCEQFSVPLGVANLN